MWYLLQGAVMFAVLASNIHFHWTPNGYLAALIAVAAAWAVTRALGFVLSVARWPFAGHYGPIPFQREPRS
jgi:hypothetical protein